MPMNALDVIRFDLQEAAEGLNRLIGSPEVLENISRAADLIVEAQKAGGKVLSCGNGGSLCDAMHFAVCGNRHFGSFPHGLCRK